MLQVIDGLLQYGCIQIRRLPFTCVGKGVAMHYMTPLLLAGVLILAQSASAQGGVEMLHESCQDAVVKADYPAAEQVCQAAVTAAEKEAQNTPLHAMTLNNLAELYYAQGHYAQAEPLFKRTLAMQEHTLGPAHPGITTTLNNLAGLYYAQGYYAQAEPLFKRALAIEEPTLGPAHPDVAPVLSNLAELYRAQGYYAQAEPLFKRALAIEEPTLGPAHPLTKAARESLVDIRVKMRSNGGP
jgi:tetratricopeptide (TPR) repeat protein